MTSDTDAGGNVTNINAFGPFGEIAVLSGTSFGFAGQRYDSELNLYYCKYRYLAPSVGRFLQPDPIGYTGSDFNLYTYAGNSPLSNTDPLGLFSVGDLANLIAYVATIAMLLVLAMVFAYLALCAAVAVAAAVRNGAWQLAIDFGALMIIFLILSAVFASVARDLMFNATAWFELLNPDIKNLMDQQDWYHKNKDIKNTVPGPLPPDWNGYRSSSDASSLVTSVAAFAGIDASMLSGNLGALGGDSRLDGLFGQSSGCGA